MAYVKILKVNNLSCCIDYVLRNNKTDFGKLISSHDCDPYTANVDFEITNNLRRERGCKQNFKIESWMIIQSFAPDETTPEQAHEIGNELAKNYLGTGHQYVVATHIDSDKTHNHIVFCATNRETNLSFDSKTKHIINDLRFHSDNLCKAYNLLVIPEKDNCTKTGESISYNEHYLRRMGKSYKATLQNVVDDAISNSDDWDSFIKNMHNHTLINQSGNNYSFLLRESEQKTHCDLSSLGNDYKHHAIIYRLENKDFNINDIRNKGFEYPELNQDKFDGFISGGLRRWETREFIKTYNEVSKLKSVLGITKEQYQDKIQELANTVNNTSNQLKELDKKISGYEEYITQHQIYRDSYDLIQAYKSAPNKEAFKKEYYYNFKEYDYAKKYVNSYKIDNKYLSPDDAKKQIEELSNSRNSLYHKLAKEKTELKEQANVYNELFTDGLAMEPPQVLFKNLDALSIVKTTNTGYYVGR